uniref:Uncharacterized protein n=1 Tax=Oryza meridionalis TaxID=40149 RepID=A0A0E0E3C7_9ORYZ
MASFRSICPFPGAPAVGATRRRRRRDHLHRRCWWIQPTLSSAMIQVRAGSTAFPVRLPVSTAFLALPSTAGVDRVPRAAATTVDRVPRAAAGVYRVPRAAAGTDRVPRAADDHE